MNDMSGRFTHATAIELEAPHFGAFSRLSPPKAFSDATARVENALAELLAAEAALERQLGDLRAYMKSAPMLAN